MAWSLAANIKGPQGDPGADASVAVATHAASSKTPPVDADELPLADSAASYGLKKLTWANLKAAVKTYYDAVSSTLTNKDLTSGTNTFPTLNQNTTGSAAKWTTARNLAGNSVDGSGNVNFSNKFIAQGTSDSGLSGAQFLGSLGTGLVKNTTTTGVLSIGAAGTDYVAPGGALGTPSSGNLTNCTFPTLNQNTSGTAANVTGTVAVANGGTGQTTLAAAGILVSGGALGTPASGNASNLTSFPTLNQNTSGNAATATTAAACSGNAATATALQTARTINGVSFNGSANIVVVPRVGTTASSGTPSIDLSLYEHYTITALAAAITGVTLSNGADGLKLVLRIKDNGTARALTFGSQFRALGVTLPTTTVVSKTLYLGGIWNSADSVLDIVALAQQA